MPRSPGRLTHIRSIILASIALLIHGTLTLLLLLVSSDGGFTPVESVKVGVFAGVTAWIAMLTIWRVFLTPQDRSSRDVFERTFYHVTLAAIISVLFAIFFLDAGPIKLTPVPSRLP